MSKNQIQYCMCLQPNNLGKNGGQIYSSLTLTNQPSNSYHLYHISSHKCKFK